MENAACESDLAGGGLDAELQSLHRRARHVVLGPELLESIVLNAFRDPRGMRHQYSRLDTLWHVVEQERISCGQAWMVANVGAEFVRKVDVPLPKLLLHRSQETGGSDGCGPIDELLPCLTHSFGSKNVAWRQKDDDVLE